MCGYTERGSFVKSIFTVTMALSWLETARERERERERASAGRHNSDSSRPTSGNVYVWESLVSLVYLQMRSVLIDWALLSLICGVNCLGCCFSSYSPFFLRYWLPSLRSHQTQQAQMLFTGGRVCLCASERERAGLVDDWMLGCIRKCWLCWFQHSSPRESNTSRGLWN